MELDEINRRYTPYPLGTVSAASRREGRNADEQDRLEHQSSSLCVKRLPLLFPVSFYRIEDSLSKV